MSLIDWLIPDTMEFLADEIKRSRVWRKRHYMRAHYRATRTLKRSPRPPISQMLPDRYEAMTRGQRFYFNGVACVHGHTDARYSKSGICVTCAIENGKRYHRERMAKERA